jgi:hypothetical protein
VFSLRFLFMEDLRSVEEGLHPLPLSVPRRLFVEVARRCSPVSVVFLTRILIVTLSS